MNYYTDISASYDKDSYFELMMKNTWGIDGTEHAADRSVMKVGCMMRGKDTWEVIEVKNSAGLGLQDFDKIRARLHKQGVHGVMKMKSGGGQKSWE